MLKRLKEPIITFQQSQLSPLFSDVFPFLRKIGQVIVADEVSAMIKNDPLKSVVIFRKIKGMIRVEVEFHYGNIHFTTNEAHQPALPDHVEILRDRKTEQQLLDLFEKYQYKAIETGFEKPIPTQEGLYRFFRVEVNAFRQLAEVKMGKKLRQLFLDGQEFQPTLEVDQKGSWLDIRFDVTGINDSEIDNVLSSLLRKDQFYTLDNGENSLFRFRRVSRN